MRTVISTIIFLSAIGLSVLVGYPSAKSAYSTFRLLNEGNIECSAMQQECANLNKSINTELKSLGFVDEESPNNITFITDKISQITKINVSSVTAQGFDDTGNLIDIITVKSLEDTAAFTDSVDKLKFTCSTSDVQGAVDVLSEIGLNAESITVNNNKLTFVIGVYHREGAIEYER